VEVLICIGIVSLILTGAYVTTHRSAIAIQDAQEHAEALKLAQGQLEQIRKNASGDSPTVFSQSSQFCMVNAAVVTTDPPCLQDSSGTATTVVPAYKLMATRADCSVGAQCSQFTIKVEWDSISTKGRAFEQIIYRLHQ
jgi:Tfp pilus assembly protein PilV